MARIDIPLAGSFGILPSPHAQLVLASLILGACGEAGGTRALDVALTVIALIVALSLPQLTLAYGVTAGIWTASYGPYKVLTAADDVLWINLGTFTPFPIINDTTTMLWLASALLIARGIPPGGCAMLLGLLTLAAICLNVEPWMSEAFTLGGGLAQTILACILHIVAGVALTKEMVGGFEKLRKHNAEEQRSLTL